MKTNQRAPTRIIFRENYRGKKIMHKETGKKYFFIEGNNQSCNKIESCRKMIDSILNPCPVGLPFSNRKHQEKRKLKNQILDMLMEMKNGY